MEAVQKEQPLQQQQARAEQQQHGILKLRRSRLWVLPQEIVEHAGEREGCPPRAQFGRPLPPLLLQPLRQPRQGAASQVLHHAPLRYHAHLLARLSLALPQGPDFFFFFFFFPSFITWRRFWSNSKKEEIRGGFCCFFFFFFLDVNIFGTNFDRNAISTSILI